MYNEMWSLLDSLSSSLNFHKLKKSKILHYLSGDNFSVNRLLRFRGYMIFLIGAEYLFIIIETCTYLIIISLVILFFKFFYGLFYIWSFFSGLIGFTEPHICSVLYFPLEFLEDLK